MSKKVKRIYSQIIILAFISAVIFLFSACQELEKFDVTYTASEGGSIIGVSHQTVAKGRSGKEVTAVANASYSFLKWSDGNTSAARQDKQVTVSINVTAEFERIEKTFTYNYNEATANDTPENITLRRGELQNISFMSPKEKASFLKAGIRIGFLRSRYPMNLEG